MSGKSNVKEDLEFAARISHVKPLGSLQEKLKPSHTALLVIDVQNDFCAPGGLISKDGRDISPALALTERLPAFLETARASGVMVVFIRCVYTTEKNFYLSDVWLEQAARKLSERVGFEGLHLLSVSLSIQSKSGGNLTEILANLSKVLRERRKLRMKIRSLSAEGRMSAIMISLFPIAMFGVLALIAPSYYGDIWGNPLIFPIFSIFGAWALLGDFIMYRMVNFDF